MFSRAPGEPRVHPSRADQFAAFDRLAEQLVVVARAIPGFLSDREVRFLALLSAFPTATGEILEIGTFRGKSAVVMARAGLLADAPCVVAVDPLTYQAAEGPGPALAELRANLQRHGVGDRVEFHQQRASDLARTWSRRLRLLWIDGDHSYSAAKSDFDLFAPFLADGAIVAMHDVLHGGDGPIRVFTEDVLGSDLFAAAGVCGSIGWAQRRTDQTAVAEQRSGKKRLRTRLRRLLPYAASQHRRHGLGKLAYKLLRARVEHGEMHPAVWQATVARFIP
jgi:predicted O-methyltransferase YrrM